MCGVAGVIGIPLEGHWVADQLATLRHRGPDSVGVYDGTGGSVGQTRLAIIDLVTGDPPVANEDGSVGVALNGEIYNYRALQAELTSQGHELRTSGDTEVIAHLAEDLDPDELCRVLDGMFAFAVWDERRRRLILGRDRMGKKPLYYWQGPGGEVVFGSEIKAVLADPRVPRALWPGAIDAYLTFGYVPTPFTFYEGILSLPPGHVLVAEGGFEPEVSCYWSPSRSTNTPPEVRPSFLEAGAEVRRLLCDAVEKRMVADVPLGAFLSGGIDSSAIVALMARLSPRRVQTFTIGFDDDDGFDERVYAASVARRFNTEHTEFVVAPDKAELIERLVWHHDQPFGDSSALPTYLLAQMTRRSVTVAISGDGGDELFAGYERHAAAVATCRLDDLGRAVGVAQRVATALPPGLARGRVGSAQRMLKRARDGMPSAHLSWVSFIGPEWRARLQPNSDDWAVRDYQRIWDESAGASALDQVLTLNLQTYLLDDLLPKADRMSMAHGLEVRSPFLDRDLVDYALGLPASYKLKGWSKKRVLKEAVRDLLPREILHRRKRGFGVPLDRWFRTDLRSYLASMLCSPSTRVAHHLDGDAVRDLVTSHLHLNQGLGHELWTLLTLEVFLRREGW